MVTLPKRVKLYIVFSLPRATKKHLVGEIRIVMRISRGRGGIGGDRVQSGNL